MEIELRIGQEIQRSPGVEPADDIKDSVGMIGRGVEPGSSPEAQDSVDESLLVDSSDITRAMHEPQSVIRRRARREWERGIDVPVLLAHVRGEEVDQEQRSIKVPAVRPISTPPRPRIIATSSDILLKQRMESSPRPEVPKPIMKVPARTFPWMLQEAEAPYEVINVNGVRITVVDMSSVGPLAGFSTKLNGLSPRAENLVRMSLQRELDEGLLFGAQILRPKKGGEDPIFVLASDGPNETKKVGVWRTRISKQRRSYVVARSVYEDIDAVNRRLGFAGYKEPPPGSYH